MENKEIAANEIHDDKKSRSQQIKEEIEKVVSLKYLSENMDVLDDLNEEGYLPIAYLLSFPSFIDLNTTMNDVIPIVSEIPGLTLSADNTCVRIDIPIQRKTIILRDTPKETTEDEVRSLFTNYEIVSIRQEVDSFWFVTFKDEESALSALNALHSQTLHDQAIKARIKSEFYKKELIRRVTEYQEEKTPSRKLSSAAAPFTMPEGSKLPTPSTGIFWGNVGLLSNSDFGYYNQSSMMMHSSLPMVITEPSKSGYEGEFIHYSQSEISDIVKNVTDLSLPEIACTNDELHIINKEANVDLVEKGRTMSIDQALREGAPRSLSVDSIDYTNMVCGYMGDGVIQTLRKNRRHHKKHS